MTATVSVAPPRRRPQAADGEQALVPSPRTNGEVTTVIAHLESDLESLKRLVAAAGPGTG